MNNEPKNPSPDDPQNALTCWPDNDESIDYIKQYIDASATSANRVRFVLLIMVTASILAFVAYWNSRFKGWPTSRLIVATDAQKFYGSDKKLIWGDDETLKQKVGPLFWEQEIYKQKRSQKERDDYGLRRVQAFESAKQFVEELRFADLDHLKEYVAFLERSRIEKVVYITVPFFGIVFDINDLGIFAGITFVIALLLFRFSLLRELRNLRLVFVQARTPEHLRLCYDMLAMQQVLTTPPQLDRGLPEKNFWNFGSWREAFWNIVSKLLYLLPFLVQLRIFIHDYDTFKQVEKIFPGTRTGLIFSGTLLIVNALLTALCFYLGWKVDGRWRNHARWILSNAPGEQTEIIDEGATPQELKPAGQGDGIVKKS